ncbi:MAG: IS1595 family transposase, partial [Acidobacteriota bacterium]
ILCYSYNMILPKTLQEAVIFFADERNCQNLVIAMRWPDGKVVCPRCGSENVSYLEKAKVFKCYANHEKAKFSLKVGTIFEDSALGLDKWLMAMWLLANCKNGISSYELSRSLGIMQKSAWHLNHRIRLAMQNGSIEKLSGEVESDSTFVGGRGGNMHHKAKIARGVNNHGGAAHMTEVTGVIERGGEVRAMVVPNSAAKTLRAIISEHIEKGSHVYTDQAKQYRGLSEDYIHWVINHTYEYVRENVHTNSIENFWSLLKRSIKGTYVSVAPEHLQAYVEEQAFRFNQRKHKDNDRGRFVALLESISGKRLTYKELIGYETGH